MTIQAPPPSPMPTEFHRELRVCWLRAELSVQWAYAAWGLVVEASREAMEGDGQL
jgi:hypothetical protein